jgi:hypothetical protein
MTKKHFLVISGLFIIVFICFIPLLRDIEEYDVQKNGELVTARITYIPNRKGFMEFTYDGQNFNKKVGRSFGDIYKVNDTINLKHKNGTDIFLFENENKRIEFISTGLLALLGISCIAVGLKRK